MSKDLKIAAGPQGQPGGGLDSATGSESSYVGASLGLPSAWLRGKGASGAAPVATLVDQAPVALSSGPDTTSAGSRELASTATAGRKRLSGTDAAPSLATPPSFPGTLGVEPKLPEGAGSRAMLELQEGHVRQAGALPSVPSGALKAGMAEASGAEGPEDEQGVGPFGGGGAQYTASLGLATPEPMRIDDRGRAEVSGYRGKSNGIAHEWAQAYMDKQYAYSKLVDADTREDAEYWAERAEDAEIRLNRADEEISRSGDADTIGKQAWEDKVRLQRREERARTREEAAARRAAQRLERKGRAWRSNRRHQVNEREKRRDQRRERRLEGRLPEESMKRWSDAQKQINQLRDRLEEIENKLDDPRTSPNERAQLERERKKTEDQIEEKKLDQYWEEHGGFPCAELDCCDPKYAKCRPPCGKGEKCVCLKPAACPDPPKEKKDEGGDDDGEDKEEKEDEKRPITPGSVSGKQPKEAWPPDAEPAPDPDGDGGEVEYPDGVGRDDGAEAESPDDGPPARSGQRRGGDAPPRVFRKGDKEYPVEEVDGEWLVQGDNGLWYRLTVAPPPKEVRDGKKVYDLEGIERDPLPKLTGKRRPNKLWDYWEAAKAIGTETTGLIAQMIGAFAGVGFRFGAAIASFLTGESKPTMDDLLGPIQELIATTDFASLSGFEAWAVNTLASLIEGIAAPGDTFRQFGRGLIESPKALAQMMKDAANGDEKAQLSLLLFAATLRPGQMVASAKQLLGKVKSVSASAIRSMAKVGATIDDVIAAIEKRPSKVRVTVDRHGQLTKIEVAGEASPSGTAGGSGAGGSGSGSSRTVAKPPPDPTKKPPATAGGGGGQKPPKRPTARGEDGDGGRGDGQDEGGGGPGGRWPGGRKRSRVPPTPEELALRDGKPLLNADDPIIDQRKFKDYALNESSPDPKARSKAEVFRKTLGYTADNSAWLEAQIRASLPDAKAKLGVTDKWGTRFEVDTQVTGPNGVTKTVRSAWIYDPGSSQPRMVTVYVK